MRKYKEKKNNKCLEWKKKGTNTKEQHLPSWCFIDTTCSVQPAVPQTAEKATMEAVMQLQVLVPLLTEAIVLRNLNTEIEESDSDIYILKYVPALPRSKLSSQASRDT